MITVTGDQFVGWVNGYIEGIDGKPSPEQVERIAEEAKAVLSAPTIGWPVAPAPSPLPAIGWPVAPAPSPLPANPVPWVTSPTITWTSDDTTPLCFDELRTEGADPPLVKSVKNADGSWAWFVNTENGGWVPAPAFGAPLS